MKITSLISASAMVLALAAPVYAQTAPATPAPAAPAATPAPAAQAGTPATPAATPATPTATPATPTGIPAAMANVAVVQQVNAQLTAQGYTITDVVKNANGSYSVMSKSATGQLRLITVNPATGAVSDTVTAGVAAGTAGVSAEGTFEHEANETEGMEALEQDGGRDHDRGDSGSDSDGGSDHDSNEGSDSDGGSDHDSNEGSDSDD